MKIIKRIICLILLNNFFIYTTFCGNLDLYNYNYSSELFRQNYLQTNYNKQVSLNYFNPNYGYISTLATFNQYNLPLSFEFGYKKLGWQNFGYEKMGFDYSNFVFGPQIQKAFQEGLIVDLSGVKTNLSGVGVYSTKIFAYVSPRESIGYATSDKIKPAFWGYDFVNKTYQGFTLPTGSSLWQANFTSLGGQVEFFASVSQNLYNLGEKVDLKKLVELPKIENLSSSVSLPKSDYQPIHIAGSDTFFPRLTQLFPQQVQQNNIGRFVSSLKTDSFNALYQPGLILHERGNLVENAVSKLSYTTAPNFYVREYSPQKGAIVGIERKIDRETESVFETTSRFMSQPGDLSYKPEELKGNVLAYKQYISPQGQVYSVVTAKEKNKVATAIVDSQKGWTKESVGYKPEQSQVTSVSQQAKFLEKNYAEIQKMEAERVLIQKEIDKKMQSAVPYSDSYTVGKSVSSANSLGTQPLPDTTLQKVKFAGLEERTNRLDLETQKAQLLLAKSLVYDDKSVKKLGLGDYISIKVTPDDMIKFSQFYLSKAEAAYKKDYFTYALANLQLATRYIPFLGHLDNMAMIQAEKIAVEKFSGTPLERSLLGTKSLSERLSSGFVFQAIDAAMYLPTYAVEYQVSLGIAGKTLGSGFILSEELQGTALLNALLTRHSITSAVMLGVNLPFTAENMMQASIPEYSLTREGTLFITRHPSTLEIIGKGFVNAWAEIWTEQAGGLLGDFGITSIGKPFKLAFLHSLPSEVFEEQVNTAINFAADLVFSGPKEGWLSNFIEQEKQTTITSALSFLPYQGFSSISSIGRNKPEIPISQITLTDQSKSDINQPPQSGLGYTAQEASRVMDVLQILERRGVEGVKLTSLGETNIFPGKPIIDVKADINQVRQALENYPRTQLLVTKFLSDYQQHDVLLFSQGKFWQFNQPNLLRALPHEAFEFRFYDVLQDRELAHQLSNMFVNYYTPQLPSFVSSYENNIPQFKPEFNKLVSDTVSKFMISYQQSPIVEISGVQPQPAVTFARKTPSEIDRLMSRLSTGDEIAFVMPAEKVGEFRNEIRKYPVHIVVGYYDVKHPIFPWVKPKYAQVLVDLKGMSEINKSLGEAGGNEYISHVTDIAEKYGGDTVLVGIQSIKRYIAPQILHGLEEAKEGSGYADVGNLNLSGSRAKFYEQWYLGNRLPNRLRTVKYFDTKGTMSRSVFVDFLEGRRSLNEINANEFLVRKVDSIGVVDKNSGRQVYFEFEYYDSKGNKINRPVKLLNEYGSNIDIPHLGDIIINHAINVVKENQKRALSSGVNVREMENELARRIQNEFKKNNINTQDLGFDISKVKIKMVCVDNIEQWRIFLQYYDDFIKETPYRVSKFSVDSDKLEKIVRKHISDIDNLIEKFREKGYDTSFFEEQKKKHLEFLAVKGVAEGWEAAYEPIYGQTFDQAYAQHQQRLSSRCGVSSQSQSQFKNLLAFNELKELLDMSQSGSGEGGIVSPAHIYSLKERIRTYNIFISKKGQPTINSIQDTIELWLKNARNCPYSLFVPGTNKINSAIADYLPDKVTDDIISYFTNEINKEAETYKNLLTVEDQKLYNIYGVDYIAAIIDKQAETEANRLHIKAQKDYLEKREIPTIAKVFRKLGLEKPVKGLENRAIDERVKEGYDDYARKLFERNKSFVKFLIYTNQVDVAEKFLFDLYDSVFKEYKSAKFAADKGDIAKLRKMLDKNYKDLERLEGEIKEYEGRIAREGSEKNRQEYTKNITAYQCEARKIQERLRTTRSVYDGALCGCSLSPQVLATLPEGVDIYKEFLDWNIRETFGQAFSRDAGAEAEGVRGFREAVHGDRNQLLASRVQRVLSNRESVENRFSEADISRGGVEGSGETADGRSDKGRGTWSQDSYSKDTLLSREVSGISVGEVYRELRRKGLELEHSAKTSLLSFVIARSLLSNLPQQYSFLVGDLLIASLLHDYDFTSQRGEKGPPRVDGVPLEMSEFFDKVGITSPLEQQVIAALIFRTDALFDEEAKRNYVILFNDIKQVDSELADWVDKFAEIVDYASRNANYYFVHSVNDIVNSVEQMSSELSVDKKDFLANLPVFLKDNTINYRLYNNLKGTILAKNLEHNFRELQEYVKNLEVEPARTREVKSELAQTFIQRKDKLTPGLDWFKLSAKAKVNDIYSGKAKISHLIDEYNKTKGGIIDALLFASQSKTFEELEEKVKTESGRDVGISYTDRKSDTGISRTVGPAETVKSVVSTGETDVALSKTVRTRQTSDVVSAGRSGESVGVFSQSVSYQYGDTYRGRRTLSDLPAASLWEDLAVIRETVKELNSKENAKWVKSRLGQEFIVDEFDKMSHELRNGSSELFDALAEYANTYCSLVHGLEKEKFNKPSAVNKISMLYWGLNGDIVKVYNQFVKVLNDPDFASTFYSGKELAQTYIQKKDKLTPGIDLIKLYADDIVNRIFEGEQSVKNLLDNYEETVRGISNELRSEAIKTFQKLKETAQTEGRRGVSVPSVSNADVRQVVERTRQNETLRGLGDKKDDKISDTVRSGEVKDNVSVGGRGESVADVSQDVTSFARHRSYRRIQRSVRLPAGSLFEDLAIFVRAIKDLDTIYQKSGWAKNRVKLEGVEEKFEQVNKVIQKGDYLLFDTLADYINAYAGVTYNYPVDRFNKSLTIEKLRELYVRSGRDIVRLYNAVETMLSAPEILRDLYNKELAQTFIRSDDYSIDVNLRVKKVKSGEISIDSIFKQYLKSKEDFINETVKYTKELKEKIKRTSGRGSVDSLHMGGVHGWYGGVDETDQWQVVGKDNIEMADPVRDRLGAEDSGVRGQRESAGIYRSANIFVQDRRVRETASKYLSLFSQSSALDEVVINAQTIYKLAEEKDIDAATRDRIKRSLVYKEITEGSSQIINVLADYFDALSRCAYNIPAEYKFNKDVFVNKLYLLYLGKKSADELIILPQYGLRNYSVIMRVIHGLVLEPNLVAKYYSVSQELAQTYIEDKEKTINIIPAEGSHVVIGDLKVNLQEVLRGDWKEDFAKDDVKKVLSGIYHAVGNLRDANLKIAVPLEVYSDVHGWLGFDFSKLAADSQADPDLVLLSYGIQSLAKTNNIDIKVIPQVSIADLTELPEVVSNIEVKQEVAKSEQQQLQQEVRAPPVAEVNKQVEKESSPQQASQPLEIPDDRILTLNEAKEIIRAHPDLNSALVDIRPISPYHQKVLLKEPSGEVVTYDMYCGKYGLSIYYKGQNVLKTNLGYVYGDKLKELFRPQLELREKNLEAVKQQTLHTQTQQVTEQEVAGEQGKQSGLRPYPVVRVAAKFSKDYDTVRNADVVVARDNFEDRILDLYHRFGQNKYTLVDSVIGAYVEFYKQIPYYYDGDVKIDLPEPPQFNTEWETFYNSLMNSFALYPEELCDKFISWYSAYLTGETVLYRAINATELTRHITPLEKVTIDDLSPHLSKNLNPLNVKLPRDNTADRLRNIYEWLTRSGYEVGVFAMFDREYGEIQGVKFVRFVVLPKGQAGDINRYAEFSAKNLTSLKIPYFDIPLGTNILETETQAKYPAGYIAIKQKGNNFKLMSLREYLLSFVEAKVAEIINKQNVDLKEWTKDVRKNINYRLQQATVYKEPLEAYKNTVVPWNMYRVVVLDENGVPISEYSNRYMDLVKLYAACYYSLREQGYNVEVYKPDSGALTLVPYSSLVFSDPGKKHNFSRFNNIASSLKTPPIIALPISQVSNDFGINIFFVVSDKYDDSLNILCDGGAWLNQNSALGKAEFYVPVKYTIELTPGVNQIIPNKIFEFISIKKELEHATGQRRDEILAQLKNFAIESKSSRIIIGDKVVNTNKLYITNVSVIGGEGFGVNLIVSGNLALPSSEVSFNLGYGGAKYVPEVVSLGRSDIDLVCSLKQGDERWVEVALNVAFTRLKEMSRKEAPLTAAQRQQLGKILAKVKSAGIEIFQTDDGVIYQFKSDRLDNKKADLYRDIIDSTDKLAKEVFGEGLLRTIKIRKNGHEYIFKGYYVLGYPTSTSAVYRYPISNGRLDAKFFEYISAKYGADVAVEMMKYLDSANKTTALSCYQALYGAFVDEDTGNNFEEYKIDEENQQRALKDNKFAQEIIRELLYTTPKKVVLPEGIYLAGKEQKYVFFPSLKHHFIDKPYKFFNDLEKSAFTVLLSPTQENVENYYRVLEEKTFTKDGLLSEIFEVHNDAVLNFGLVVPRGGQGYTTVEISREALLRFNGGEKLLNKLAKGEKVYAVVLRHPLISPDTLAVVELKLSDDNTPLKIHPVLWSVLKGDFDKDGAVLVTSDDMQKILSSMYRQQQTLGTAKLDKQIEEKLVSLAEDYTHKNVLDEAFEKVKKTKKNAAYDIAGTIGGSLRVLTGNIHWSMYELREFVRSLYETCELTPQDYLKYAEILWKIEQQPISGKKIADLFTNTEAEILNNPNVPIDTKLKMIESAFARNGLDVVIDLSRWNRTRTVSPVRLGHLIKWQDFVSKSARLTSQDIDEFIMLTNLYFNHRRMGLSKYREGLAAEMTRAELLNDVPVGWHLVNTLSNRHPYSYWERIVCEKLGIEFTPLPGEAVIISGQSWEKIQGERINRSVLEQTVGQAEEQVKENNITSKNPSIDLSNATGEDIATQPAQQKTETRVDEAVVSSAEDTFVAEESVVEINQKQPSSTRGIFVHKGFPVNLNRGVVIVGDLREAHKFKEFVYTQKEIKNIVEEYNKKGVINGDRASYVVDKLAYFDNNTGKYSKIPANIDYSQFVICVNDFVDALRLVEYYKIPVLAIDLNYVKFNKRDLLKTMLDCINANVKDIYVYSPRVGIGNVACFTLATLLGRVDLAVKDLKLPWIKVPYSGYITEERIHQELTELNKKTLRNRIVRWISVGAMAVGSYLGIDYYLKHQDVDTKTVTVVKTVKGRSYVEKVDIKESSVEVAIQEEDLAHRAWEALRAEGRLPVNISYDDLVGVKYAAYRSYFREGLKQHLGIQNELTLRDLERLSFDEVKEISLKAAKVALETADKVTVASEKTEESASQAQQTQQTTQQETQKTVVTLPVVNQTKPPVIDGITIRSISVKRGDPTSVFVNFNNDLFIKCRAVQEGDKIRIIPIGLQVSPKFMDFVTAWYTDWLKNSYDPQRGNGGYEEFTVENIDLSPEVNVMRQRNGKYIVSVFFGDALWFEKEIDVGPRGGISGLEVLPKNLRDEVRKQVRKILNLPEPPAGPPIGGGLSMNLFKQLLEKANQGDEHARRVLEFYKKDFPELYYKQAQRSQMYEPKYGGKDKIVYIIVSNRPQVGKSMVGNIIAGKVGGRYIATSDVLVEILAQKLGIKPEDIKRARAKNPEAYRKELIQLGDNLTRKRVNWKGEVEEIPTTPGEEALRKALDEGANIVVIDGIRRRSELRKIVLNIPYGYKCIKIGVFGYSQSIDNTEHGLLYDCDYVIFSRGIQSKDEVVQEIDDILSGVKEIPQHWVQKYKNTKEFVVLDLETTGLSRDSQIIQIAVLKCKKQGRGVSVTDKYVNRVRLVNTNLDRDTVEEVKRITGIDLTETANEGKDVKHVLVEIEKYLLNYPVVMHNAAFDLEVLNYWRQKYGMLPFTPKVLFDTKALAKFLYPASETHLETLAQKYGIQHTNPHDAENDALVTAKVFNKLFVTKPRTSSAGSSLSDSSNQKNELAQTYVEGNERKDKEILNSDLKNDIINLEDKDYGHKVNDTTQQGKNKDQTLYPAERDSRKVDENLRGGEKEGTEYRSRRSTSDDKVLDISRSILSFNRLSKEEETNRYPDRRSSRMVRTEVQGEGVSEKMVQPREKQDFLECCKKALAEINRRGIGVVLFGQGSLRAYAILKGFEVRETVDLDFIMNYEDTDLSDFTQILKQSGFKFVSEISGKKRYWHPIEKLPKVLRKSKTKAVRVVVDKNSKYHVDFVFVLRAYFGDFWSYSNKIVWMGIPVDAVKPWKQACMKIEASRRTKEKNDIKDVEDALPLILEVSNEVEIRALYNFLKQRENLEGVRNLIRKVEEFASSKQIRLVKE